MRVTAKQAISIQKINKTSNMEMNEISKAKKYASGADGANVPGSVRRTKSVNCAAAIRQARTAK